MNATHDPARLRVAAAASLAFVMAVSPEAGARTCTAAMDCPLGFQCTAADGGNGSSCTSVGCQSASDCAAGFSCYEAIDCVAGPGGSSVPGNACVPQWQARCTTDADCGEGFRCYFAGGACDCSGTGKSVPAGAATVSEPCEALVPPLPPCTDDAGTGCPSSPSLCDAGSSCLCWGVVNLCMQIQTFSCSARMSCPAGWTCSRTSCEPPNSDLAFQGGLSSGTLTCGSNAGGFGGPGGPTPPAGQEDAGDDASTFPPPASARGGNCTIAAPATPGAPSPFAFVLGLAAAAAFLRRTRCARL